MSDQEDMIPAKRQKVDTDKDKPIQIEQTNETIEQDAAIDFSEDVTERTTEFTTNSYNDVSQEELAKLREFKVLDEVKSNDEDDESGEDSFDEKSEGVPEEEIEKMLEEDLPDGYKGAPKPKEKHYVNIQKILLEEKGVNPFEVLPLDWILVRHFSGMPVYMHRTTRVCTLSKPYSLGLGNIRRHEIPISAIPCLAYRKALEEEEKQKERDRKIQEQIESGSWRNNLDSNTTKNYQSNNLNGTLNEKSDNCDKNRTLNVDDNKVSNSITEKVENNELDLEKINANSKQVETKLANECVIGNVLNKECPQINETNRIESNNYIGSKSDVIVDNEQNVIANISENAKENEEVDKAKCPVLQGNKNDVSTEDLAAKPVVLPGGIVMPPPRVETVSTSWKTQHLTSEQLNDYCKRLFHFKIVNIKHFTRWADRRKHAKSRKALQFPALPEGSKLITIPASQDNGTNSSKRDWVMNMNGRSYLSVFHEYVRRSLQKQPVYEFQQIENASTPYQATVYIGGMQYGVGRGSSKRIAKNNAARESIHILIPEMRDDRPENNDQQDFTFFDCVGIEDPRISELCAATCEPSPHAVLRTCLLRNFGANDRHINTEMKKLEYHKIELTMKVGKHTATVICKNKKMAKQRASQAILQALHPHIRSWGSLLRLYGSKSVKTSKENKMEERQITLLQDKAQHNEPNYAVLEKLRQEMRRLRERDEAVVPIGTLLVKDDLPTHSGSNLNNVDL